MGVNFFQNGVSIGASAGWGGYTGSNNYVVRYDFTTAAAGGSSVSVTLGGIYYGNSAGTQGFGFKLSTSGAAWANARAETPDSGLGYMQYSASSGYGCTMSASGLNLAPYTTYYIFIYVATGGAEYYTGWNCTAPQITVTGEYTPPASSISSVSAKVSTQSAVSIIMNRAGGLWHKAEFYHGGEKLTTSAPFAAALSHICPRTWMQKAPTATSMEISVLVQSYTDEACSTPTGAPATASFTLTADEDMRPDFALSALTISPVNSGVVGINSFISGVSCAQVQFDPEKIDLSACAGAAIAQYSVSVNGERTSSTSGTVQTGVLAADCELVCTVKDTRGRESSVTKAISVLPYVAPSLNNIKAERCTADGESAAQGAYIRLSAVLSYTTLGGRNSATVKACIQPTGAAAGEQITLTAFTSGVWSDEWVTPTLLGGELTGDGYTLKLYVKDMVGQEREYRVQIYHQQWAMKFNATGTAVGFGMSPTAENAVQLPDTWRLYAGRLVLGESAYGVADPAQAVQNAVEGQLYFKLKD